MSRIALNIGVHNGTAQIYSPLVDSFKTHKHKGSNRSSKIIIKRVCVQPPNKELERRCRNFFSWPQNLNMYHQYFFEAEEAFPHVLFC